MGSAIDEIIEVTEWQGPTVRGVISGALKKKLGLPIASERGEGRGSVYRIARRRSEPRQATLSVHTAPITE